MGLNKTMNRQRQLLGTGLQLRCDKDALGNNGLSEIKDFNTSIVNSFLLHKCFIVI